MAATKTLAWIALLVRATTPADRWLMALAGVAILALAWRVSATPAGGLAVVHRENRPLLTLALDQDRSVRVPGRLGEVTVQVKNGQVRLLEYVSPRLIGTRTGWIGHVGETTACVPCGILIQVAGDRTGTPEFDAIAH